MSEKRARSLMVLGTGSGVGKSVIVAGILRVLRKRGIKCAPFKAQNMALNSFVTLDGKEMGRAQAYQAEAAGILPDCRMNPILLKPNGDSTSQVIVLGEPKCTIGAREYYRLFPQHQKLVNEIYDELSKEYEVIVMEGAGSPAEINLQSRDLVNTKMAAHANAPCILVGDIDKGGVFAWLKGTIDLIETEHKHLIKGLLINKFRGDVELLRPGLKAFEEMVGIPFLGVLPWLQDVIVDQEDGMFARFIGTKRPGAKIRLGIIHLKRISNFTDFIPFSLEEDCEITLIDNPDGLQKELDCVIIPGSKATRSDLEFLEKTGLKREIIRLASTKQVVILGICGGFQMMGKDVQDSCGIEGPPGSTDGLGLLPVVTKMLPQKHLSQTTATILFPESEPIRVEGYEIHSGVTYFDSELDQYVPVSPDNSKLGLMTKDGLIIGTYLHGLFENDILRRRFLDYLRLRKGMAPLNKTTSYRAFKEKNLDTLANWIEEGIGIEKIFALLDQSLKRRGH
ncbi:Cobyric acid synthase [Dissulfuribacter thermophilus]|uniref:Cobyric acid synthase n=1 Tax=Dissulfuribacter thermophilus TaxID=1156395 RepID=A0A1B9F587_9BACT|nr:cobyric acid synthase [Dissulfuribacter thermophilus]OCC15023.1 Cobyric acid synthase [Dissulfuribacter thermophilus]